MAQMRAELTELLQKGAVAQIEQARGGFYSTLFLVPKKDGRQRPIINLKALNQYVQTYHFKMEGLQTLKDLIKPGDWLAKVDLKDAYCAIPIDPSHRKYLRFVVDNQTYQFNCLPFGLAAAPWVFTKTLKPVASYAAPDGGSSDLLHRRHTPAGGDPDSGGGAGKGATIHVGMSRLYCAPRQINHDPGASDGSSWE